MSRDVARRRRVRLEPEPETGSTDEEIHQGWARLRREVRSELRTIEGLIRRREQGMPMSPDRVRYLLRRRRELREAMQLLSDPDPSGGVASLGPSMRHPHPAGDASGAYQPVDARSLAEGLEDHRDDGPGGVARDLRMALLIRR